jgi:hypothetical protein
MKRKLNLKMLIGVIALFITSTASGQIATPSLDTSIREDLAAATGWRYSSTVAASAVAGTWNEIYQGADSDVVYGEVTYLLASHIYGPLYSEAFNAAVRKDSENVQDYNQHYQNTRSQVNFALRIFDDFLCLGGHYSSSTVKQSDETPINKTASVNEQTGIGLGASLGLGDWLFIAGGLETVSEESNVEVSNNWMNYQYAIALRDGFDDDSSYRFEYAKYISQESIAKAEGNLFKNSHFARSSTRMSAEYMLESLRTIFRYENEYTIESVASDQNLVLDYTTYGVTWKPPKSWVVGFEIVTGKEKAIYSNSSLNHEKADPQYFRLKLGYSFGGTE